jgi:hypothetical protein
LVRHLLYCSDAPEASMKRLALTILGILAAVMTFVVVAPEVSAPVIGGWWNDPDLIAIQQEVIARQDSVRTMSRVYDRLVALEVARAGHSAARGRPAGPRLTFVKDPALSATVHAAFERRIRDELGPLGDSLKYPVRVHLVHDSTTPSSYVRVVVLPRDETEACALVLLITRPRGRDVLPQDQDRLIGTCGFFAAFGAPGEGMRSWLLQTRGRHAVADIPMPLRTDQGRWRLSGAQIASAPEVAACLAGSDSACVSSWASQGWMERTNAAEAAWEEATRGALRAFTFSARNGPGRNLGDLRGAMTDARFQELWRSTLEPAAAYESIEGRSIGLFMRERLLREMEPHRPGPLQANLPLALGLGIGALAATLAIRLTKRQRSGP